MTKGQSLILFAPSAGLCLEDMACLPAYKWQERPCKTSGPASTAGGHVPHASRETGNSLRELHLDLCRLMARSLHGSAELVGGKPKGKKGLE